MTGLDLGTILTMTYQWIKAAHLIFVIFWIAGITLATIGHWWAAPWLGIKLLLVLGLSGYHGYMIGYGKKLAAGQRPVSGRALRLMNEVPGIAVAAIVILVVVKPFS